MGDRKSSTMTGAMTAAAGLSLVASSGYLLARRRRPQWSEPTRRGRMAGPLHVTTAGGGAPLVLLHGLVGSGRFWGAAYDGLAHEHFLVVPDLLGFGRSDRPDHGYGPDAHAAAIIGALDDLGVEEPVVIGAHSLGTVVALRLAASHPDRVANITAFGPPLYRDRIGAKLRIGAASPMAKLFVLPGSLARRACRVTCDHRRGAARVARFTHPGLPPALAGDAVQHTWGSYSETLDQCLLTGEPAGWLPDIRVPVHLVAGDHDRVVDHEFLAELGRMPGIDVEFWEGDHRLPLTHPDRCIRAILS